MFSIHKLESSYKDLININKNYKALSLPERAQADAHVMAIMRQAEAFNSEVLKVKMAQLNPTSQGSVDTILKSSEKFVNMAEKAAERKAEKAPEKAEEVDQKTKSFIQKARDEAKSLSAELKRKAEKKEEKKTLGKRIEEGAMKLSEGKRKELAGGIQERYGQGPLARKAVELAEKGYKLAKDKKWIKTDTKTDMAIDLMLTINEVRNGLVDEATNLILEPRNTMEKYFSEEKK